ncbi:MAG: hypothetical protein ACRDN6_07945, partial [Gaiellaceae bacterium]
PQPELVPELAPFEVEPEPEPVAEAEPMVEREPEPEPAPVAEAEPEPQPAADTMESPPQPELLPELAPFEVEPEPEPVAEAEPEVELEPWLPAETTMESPAQREPAAEAAPFEPEPEPAPEPEQEPAYETEPKLSPARRRFWQRDREQPAAPAAEAAHVEREAPERDLVRDELIGAWEAEPELEQEERLEDGWGYSPAPVDVELEDEADTVLPEEPEEEPEEPEESEELEPEEPEELEPEPMPLSELTSRFERSQLRSRRRRR